MPFVKTTDTSQQVHTERCHMTKDRLQARSKKELADLARRKGITGWHGMRKEELVNALACLSGAGPVNTSAKKCLKKTAGSRPQLAAARNTNGTASAEEQVERSKYDVGVPTKDLSVKVPRDLPGGYGKDRIVVMVRDPYWLHCYWELTHRAIQRAEAALGQDWHTSRPILRLLHVSSRDMTAQSESVVKDIDIHGGCN